MRPLQFFERSCRPSVPYASQLLRRQRVLFLAPGHDA
jgi:hypothetical protein